MPNEIKPLEELNPPPSVWRVATTHGWLAAKQNKLPGFLLWLFGVAIIAGYFFVPPVRELLDLIGQFKLKWGLIFSLISTAVFGGLIPTLIARYFLRDSKVTFGLVFASTVLWAYKGIEIDLFYQLQAFLFGTSLDVSTIAIKTVVDQLVMVPLFGMVNVILFFVWRDCRYSFRKTYAVLTPGWYQRLVLPVLIANWVIWIPAVAMIYCLPVSLQLPVQNLILCFWVLILIFFTGKNSVSSVCE